MPLPAHHVVQAGRGLRPVLELDQVAEVLNVLAPDLLRPPRRTRPDVLAYSCSIRFSIAARLSTAAIPMVLHRNHAVPVSLQLQ